MTQQQSAQRGVQTQQRQFLAMPQPGQLRAADMRSANIYTADNQRVGDIDDILLDSRGNIIAVVVGVGGFLGIGQKNVAIPFESLDLGAPGAAVAGTTTETGAATTTTQRAPATTGAVPPATTTDQTRQTTTAQRAEDVGQQQATRQQQPVTQQPTTQTQAGQAQTTTTTTTTQQRTAQATTTGIWKPERIILRDVTKADLEAAPEFNWEPRRR
jgi:hypothetical protein